MISFFVSLPLVIKALLATLFTFFITALGSSVVFFFKKVNNTVLDAMLGLSAGVMIAASFWSLLNPAIEQAKALHMISHLVVGLGFLSGAIFLILSDLLFSKRVNNNSKIKRNIMLIFSITLHNIPEGLAIGVAFGSLSQNIPEATLMGAIMLAVGVGIQNFPEGSAISLPLRRDGNTRAKSFIYGALSGIVEPISGVLGCILVLFVRNILPFFLSFAAGAMIYVAVSELIPESQKNNHRKLISLSTIIGFMIMMILDIAL